MIATIMTLPAAARHPRVSTTWTEPGHAYGNTETFPITTCFRPIHPRTRSPAAAGKPLPGNTVEIVDPLTGAVAARGEICVKG
jgi:fatty-acyl-CoA synthase